MKFREYIKEQKSEASLFALKFENIMKKYFPNSFIQANFIGSISPSITMRFAMGKKNEWNSGIIQNDPLFHVWHIFDLYEDKIPAKIKIDLSTGGTIGIFNWTDDNGVEHNGPGHDFRFPKIGWRNKTGTPEQVLKHFDNYFKKMKLAVKKYIKK